MALGEAPPTVDLGSPATERSISRGPRWPCLA